MADYALLKSDIQQYIKQNGNNEITGALLQQELLAMVNSLGAGYQYMGCATPATNPGTPDQNVFYFAGTAGTYTNFGGLVVENEAAILKYNGSWTREYTGIKFVTISQNTSTGHIDIEVGGNPTSIPSLDDTGSIRPLSYYTTKGTQTSNSWKFNDIFLEAGKTYYVKKLDGDAGNFAVGDTSFGDLLLNEWKKIVVPNNVSGFPYSYVGTPSVPVVIKIVAEDGVRTEIEPINKDLKEITEVRYIPKSTFAGAGSGSIWSTNSGLYPSVGQYQKHTNKIAVTPGQKVVFDGKGYIGDSRSLCSFAFFDNTTDENTWSDLTGFIIGVVGIADYSSKSAIAPDRAAYVVVSYVDTIENGGIEDEHLVATPVESKTIVITVDRDENSDADFTGLHAIADAINSISDASYAKRYIVHIKGEFHFTDPADVTMLNSYGNEYSVIDMKPYIDIEGEGADKTVIFVDFPANATFPEGFHYNDYQPVFFCGTGGNIRDMKIIGKNCRYAFHIEVGNGYFYKGENTINIDSCEVVSLGAPDYASGGGMGVFGTGMIPGTIWNIRNCKLINEKYESAFGMHTPLTPFKEAGRVNFINCIFKGNVILANYQIENNSFVNMVDCTFHKSIVPRLSYSYYNSRASAIHGNYTRQLFNGDKQKLFYYANAAYENKGAVLRVVSNSTGTSSIVRFGKTSNAFNAIVGDSSIDAVTKTIYGWDTQYGVVYRDGGVGLSGQAFGTLDIDETSSTPTSSLGVKLGDCSSVNKTLIINIDGTDYTITFNENYTSKDNAYVIGKINDVIGEVATADVFCPAKLYYPNINGLCEVESGDSGAILKGMGVVFNNGGKMVKAKNSDSRIDGICLDDTSLGQTGRVISKGYIATHFANQWFKTVDSLDYVPSVRFGLTMGIDPDNDGQFKLLATPALLRCKNDCFEIL